MVTIGVGSLRRQNTPTVVRLRSARVPTLRNDRAARSKPQRISAPRRLVFPPVSCDSSAYPCVPVSADYPDAEPRIPFQGGYPCFPKVPAYALVNLCHKRMPF